MGSTNKINADGINKILKDYLKESLPPIAPNQITNAKFYKVFDVTTAEIIKECH
jgi:hypothetical protein